MGCGMSTEDKEGKARNEEIENQLKRDRMQQRNEIKMLLLGMFQCCSADKCALAISDADCVDFQVLVNPESQQS